MKTMPRLLRKLAPVLLVLAGCAVALNAAATGLRFRAGANHLRHQVSGSGGSETCIGRANQTGFPIGNERTAGTIRAA